MNLAFALKTRPALDARVAALIDPGFSGVVMATRNGLTVLEAAHGGACPETPFAIDGLADLFAQAAVLQLIQAGAIDLPLAELDAPRSELVWLVEAAAGQSYAAYVARRLFRPAGMTRSRPGPAGAAATARDLAAFARALSGPRLLDAPFARWFIHARPAWDAAAPGVSAAVRLLDDGEAAVIVLARSPAAPALADAVAAEMEVAEMMGG